MIPDYHFRADHPGQGSPRLMYILFYTGAALLLAAAIYEFYLYFTHWAVGDERGYLWQLILGIIYLIVSGIVAYFTYRRSSNSEEAPPDRYVIVQGGVLTYELDQLNGKQRLDLSQLAATSRPSVRDIVLTMRDGREVVLPIYLIDEEDKQAELEALLQKAAGTNP